MTTAIHPPATFDWHHIHQRTHRPANLTGSVADARSALIQRIRETHDVIDTVLRNPPYQSANFPGPDELVVPTGSREQLPAYARLLISDYLDRFKSDAFSGQGSPQLAVTGKRLSKQTRRLYEAIEQFEAHTQPLTALAENLAASYPGHGRQTYELAASALDVLVAWDNAPVTAVADLARALLESTERDGRVRLALFVCPPADFTRLSSEKPELYLRTDMHGSVLSRQVDRLRALFEALRGAEVPFGVHMLVGDTDETDYLWRGVEAPRAIDQQALEARRSELAAAVAHYLTEPVAGAGGLRPRVLPREFVRVERLSAMTPSSSARRVYEDVAAAPYNYFTRQDMEAELAIMRGLWRPGSYYDGLPEPDTGALTRIVIHKFAAYAMQGRMLRDIDTDLLLVQTERPPLLREKMLNTGWRDAGHAALPSALPPALPSVSYFKHGQ